MNRTIRSIVCILLVALTATVAFSKERRPTGENCSLSAPPPSAGEEAHMGTKLFVYPRIAEIGKSYSGCQSLWVSSKDGVELAILIQVEDGLPVRSWTNVPEEKPGENCRYKGSKLVVGIPNQCTEQEYLLLHSIPAGCFAKIQTAISAKEPRPQDCDYD